MAKRKNYSGKGKNKSFRITPKNAPLYILLLLLLWGLNKLNPEHFPFELPKALEQGYVEIPGEEFRDSGNDVPDSGSSQRGNQSANKGSGDGKTSGKSGNSGSRSGTPARIEMPEVELSEIPPYSGQSYVFLNGNVPDFPEEDKEAVYSFEEYSELDSLGRCGPAYANISTELMPRERRGEIGEIRPSGWRNKKYEGLVEGNFLYNRCHLIAFQLAGENANERNLITGTRYMNTEMIPFETEVADYVRTTKNHVLYRVAPVFEGDNLVASGVSMEAWSVEDEGKGVSFHVYLYNVQPGIEIDYATGRSKRIQSQPRFGKSKY